MGALAFGFLMLAELALSVGLFGRSINEYARDLTTLRGLVGLGGQVVFALIPLLRLTIESPEDGPRAAE